MVDLKPDRVALYGYAHLPARFKPQRHIDASTLPNATQKTAMLAMALMCQGQVDFESIESAHLLNFKESFAKELAQLQPMTEQGLVRLTDQAIEVTELGWYFVRAIAMVFDRYVQSDQQRSHFSKIL